MLVCSRMALYTLMSLDQLADVLACYGLPPPTRTLPEPKGSVNTNYHLWSGGRRWFLRLNEGKTRDDVAFEAQVLRFLAGHRFPAAPLVLTPGGDAQIEVAGRPAMLFAFAEGEELERGGDALVAPALPMLRDELLRTEQLPEAPRGLVHGDLFLDNVLWVGERVSALLDWEMSCVDALAYDLGVMVNAWCYGERYEPELARALVAGYRSEVALDPATAAALYPYARYVALRYTASRIHAFHRAALSADRLAWKDWTRYRDRLAALRSMGEDAFRTLVAV